MKKLFAWIMVVALLFSICIVSVFAFIYGDINCDGDIRTNDAVLLAQYLADWQVNISDDGLAAADVRKDGQITSADAVLLAQYLAMWQVDLGVGPGAPSTPDTDNSGEPGVGDNEIGSPDIFG